MALFNKFFTNRKSTHKLQDNVSEKLFAFSKDQVRVVLFRECDFRGRKLLFDSTSIKKVPVNQSKPGETPKTKEHERLSEVSDGFGYIYTKPQPDFNQLAEMVFGSVAMSFRGTYFKMHCLDFPSRLMFTQVFSSPKHTSHRKISISSRSDSHNLEHSFKWDDSGASSTTSVSERLSVHSTASDTLLVSRRRKSSPLDVPIPNSIFSSNPNIIGDSGYCADQSLSSGPASISTWSSVSRDNVRSAMSLSSGSLYRRWLRRNSTSLENSGCSLPSAGSTAQDGIIPRNSRASKLGLAFILQLTEGQEEELSQFFMEHVNLLEAMLWRARQTVETAYIKSHNFASLMYEMANFTSQYLVNLLSGSFLSMNMWLSLSSGCDNYNSISAFSGSVSDKTLFSSPGNLLEMKKNDLNNSATSLTSSLCNRPKRTELNSVDFGLFNFSRILRTDWDPFSLKKNFFGEPNFTAGKFLQDFCELLETIDVKDTNFFMSTLVTAILTHHLGWVSTCLPPSIEPPQQRAPYNPLWGELSDLYGAAGHPMKVAQTIITGANRKDLISKILVTMTYFIRCCDVERRVPIRANVEEENQIVETICNKYECIPKENYKRYEDHLREIMNTNSDFLTCAQQNANSEMKNSLKRTSGLTKTRTCLGNLSNLEEDPDSNISYRKSNESLSQNNKRESPYADVPKRSKLTLNLSCDNNEITRKSKLCRVSSSVNLCYMENEATVEKQAGNGDLSKDENNSDVVFVLGDNEQLIGLRKDNRSREKQESDKGPSIPNISKLIVEDTGIFKDDDFVENPNKSLIKPSTSWTSLSENDVSSKNPPVETVCGAVYPSNYARSQSEPPEDKKIEETTPKNTSRYRYSGVKFNLQQYPQILSNYMKSKNLEMSSLHFGDKNFKIDELSSLSDTITAKYPSYVANYDESEALQTPSNASELEFISDLPVTSFPTEQAKETKVESTLKSTFVKQHVPNTIIKEATDKCENIKAGRKISCINHKMKVTNLPMPKTQFYKPLIESIKYTSTLMRAASESYMSDMVLQGPLTPKQSWESMLKNDLALASQHSLIDQPVEEAVAVIANTDSWDVHLMSSHTFTIDRNTSGVRVGMSQLVANMLESLLQMWKLNVPPQLCLMHIEQTLQEFCVRSKALAEVLLATEFCSIEHLTSTLHLEVNDVPLLLAVASTHSPQVTQKYGLSFQ